MPWARWSFAANAWAMFVGVQFRFCAGSGGRPKPAGADRPRIGTRLRPPALGPAILAQVRRADLQHCLRSPR